MTKTDWTCATAAAIIGGSLLVFIFLILLKPTPDIIVGAGGVDCYQPEGCKLNKPAYCHVSNESCEIIGDKLYKLNYND